jgi:hypothetical protein
MKDPDTVTIVIASVLVLPWLARVLASTKAIWRASNLAKKREKEKTFAALAGN